MPERLWYRYRRRGVFLSGVGAVGTYRWRSYTGPFLVHFNLCGLNTPNGQGGGIGNLKCGHFMSTRLFVSPHGCLFSLTPILSRRERELGGQQRHDAVLIRMDFTQEVRHHRRRLDGVSAWRLALSNP